MIRRPPRSTLFPTRRSSDLRYRYYRPYYYYNYYYPVPSYYGYGYYEQNYYPVAPAPAPQPAAAPDRKSTRLNSSHSSISYAVFCLKKKKTIPCTTSARV